MHISSRAIYSRIYDNLDDFVNEYTSKSGKYHDNYRNFFFIFFIFSLFILFLFICHLATASKRRIKTFISCQFNYTLNLILKSVKFTHTMCKHVQILIQKIKRN